MRSSAAIGLVLAGAIALGAGGSAGAGMGMEDEPDADVAAAGTPVTGDLAFEPATIRVEVGDVVRWTNTNPIVPHTATEDHFLWRLAGDYGDPLGLFPTGIAPGESRQRAFEAGTHNYFCEVHGDAQRGVVEVPVTLRQRRAGGKPRVIAVWSKTEPTSGLVYDVQRRRGSGDWSTVRDGTTENSGKFRRGAEGTRWSFRARLRDAADPAKATGWSPRAKIRVG